MDSLIRLDVLMPIAPLTANSVNTRNPHTYDNSPNSVPPPITVVEDSSNLDEMVMPDLIDLTNANEEADSKLKRIPAPPLLQLNDFNRECSGVHNQTTTKHKLPPLISPSPSKVLKTNSNELGLDLISPNQNSPGRSGSVLPVQPILKNHTVTSSDLNNGPQRGLAASLSPSTSGGQTALLHTNSQHAQLNLSNPSLVQTELYQFNHRPTILPQNVHQETTVDEQIHNELVPIPWMFSEIASDSGLRINRVNESPVFYQLLDMFPDIDLNFLKSQCCSGLNINQISEIILEMNEYPKANFSNCVRPTVTTTVMSGKSTLPTSSSSTITRPALEFAVDLIDDQIKNNTLPVSSIPDPFSFPGHSSTIANKNQLIAQVDKRHKKNNDSRPTLSSRNTNIKLDKVVMDGSEKNRLQENKADNLVNRKNEKVINQLNFLMGIFPDADPAFLEVKSKLDNVQLRNFISEMMETGDYPKLTVSSNVQCSGDNEVEDEIGLYTNHFNMESFLKIFPDPFEYFINEKRFCQYTEHGFQFLKRRYRCHAIKLISLKYKELKFNLVQTCEFLDAEKPSRTTKRGLNDIKMPEEINLPFLQEACFIEHKAEIKKCLDGVAETKRLAYEQAEEKGELIECGCCYQKVLFEDCATCNEGHLFCKTCIRRSVEVRIGDGHTTFPCLQECDSVFSLQLLEALVDVTMFSRLLQRIQLDEVKAADIEGLEVCPFCDFAIILPPETNIFKCLNPECLKESCRKCHKLSHIPQRCEEVENDDQARARKYIEDEMTRALVRVCYKCKASFIKTDGCNKMTCSCGAKMCYICRKPIVDYKHFNGPGGDKKDKCPLYSTEKLLHVDAVEAVAKKALQEVSSKNPELKLKHDPTTILPSAKSVKTTLPPGVNEEAERMMVLLQDAHRVRNGQVHPHRDPVRRVLNDDMILQHQIHLVHNRIINLDRPLRERHFQQIQAQVNLMQNAIGNLQHYMRERQLQGNPLNAQAAALDDINAQFNQPYIIPVVAEQPNMGEVGHHLNLGLPHHEPQINLQNANPEARRHP